MNEPSLTVNAALPDLRLRLRQETGQDHVELDTLMSTLDLSTPEGRDVFSHIQYRGMLRLGRACGWEASEATSLIRNTVASLQQSFPGDAPAETDEALDGDAVAYVALGSQLGLTVLRRSLEPHQQTGAFEHEPDLGAWKAFARRIAEIPSGSGTATRLVEDARRAFRIFQSEAARLINPPTERTT
ncbi:hypothetical protein ACFO5X_23340 [Seohaeicola nanhaiensis]|uniref:Heme oxygenase n=1 Tax=Seohaeicola nanhaiensis TaxID=1387282 RepID=A0ABV9KMX4_9RHOB